MSWPSAVTVPEVGVDDAADDVDQRRLAGAVRPEQREDLAAADLEIDVLERLEARCIGLDQIDDGDDRLHAAGIIEKKRIADAMQSVRMSIQRLFPTLVYTARLNGAAALNRRLLPECRQLERDDESGRRWSAKNYPGGYTSYNSASRMHELSPTFAQLKRGLDRHVASFAKSLEFDLEGPRAADDRLLGQHHAAAGRAQPAPASARDDQRHVLRPHAARLRRIEAGRSAARSLHGRAAAEG